MSLWLFAQGELLKRAKQAAGGGQAVNATPESLVAKAVDIFIYVIGAVAVIALIVGGLRYVLSGGDPKAAAGAKNAIVFALIGLVVALLAYAAVNTVLSEVLSP